MKVLKSIVGRRKLGSAGFSGYQKKGEGTDNNLREHKGEIEIAPKVFTDFMITVLGIAIFLNKTVFLKLILTIYSS